MSGTDAHTHDADPTDASMAPADGAREARPRTPALDGARGLAVLLVMVHHAEISSSLPTDLGSAGVRLFFVLSGFLITRILLDGRRDLDVGVATTGGLLKAFFARRALRLVPAYFLVLAVLVAAGAPLVREQLAWHALYATSILVALEDHWVGLASHFWSLSVEEQFYLLWPAVVLATPRRALPWICAALVALGPAYRATGALLGVGRFALSFTLPGSVDALGAGALLACLLERPQPWLGNALAAVGASGALLLALVTTSASLFRGLAIVTDVARAAEGFSHAALAAALVGGLALAPTREPPRAVRVFEWAPLRYVGRVSYGLYLVHPLVPYGLRRLGVDALAWPVVLLSGFAIPIAIAALSWHLLEAPLLRRFPGSRLRP